MMRLFRTLSCLAIVFDKDGTLIDTESVWFSAIARVLRTRRFDYDVSTHARIMGGSMDSCLRVLADRYPGSSVTREELLTAFCDVRAEVGIVPMPGAREILESCRRSGIPMALATSARREDTETELDALQWRDYFSVIVTSQDVRSQKPAPDIYLEAARRLDVAADRCLAFEDGLLGSQSACDAGMQTVFVRDPRFALPSPTDVVTTVGSLLELL